MRALITGGAGFIGSHLAEALLNEGHEVDIIDNLSTGSIRNVGHLKANPEFKYVIDTLTNEPLLAELIDRNDVIFHFAAAVGVKLIVEAAGAHDRNQRARHRSRAEARQQEEKEGRHRVHVRGVRKEHWTCRSARTPTS